MAKRICYQCDEDLEEIAERRNAEIRAWGQEVLRVADAALLEQAQTREGGDWDLIELQEEPEPVEEIEETPHIIDAEVVVPAKTGKKAAPAAT